MELQFDRDRQMRVQMDAFNTQPRFLFQRITFAMANDAQTRFSRGCMGRRAPITFPAVAVQRGAGGNAPNPAGAYPVAGIASAYPAATAVAVSPPRRLVGIRPRLRLKQRPTQRLQGVPILHPCRIPQPQLQPRRHHLRRMLGRTRRTLPRQRRALSRRWFRTSHK